MEYGNIFPHTESRSGSERLVGIASLCLTLNLAGFLVVSYVPGVLHINHRAATVPFRCLVLALSLYAVYKILALSHLRLAVSVTTLLAVVFWTLYVTRFISDTVLFPVSIGENPDDIALFLFGMCLPTFIVFYLFGEIHLYSKALVWSMLALGVCSAISMRLTQAQEDKLQGLHMGNDILNHIGYGHMGLTAMILGLFVLLQIGRVKRGWTLRLLAAATVCFGAFSILAASSRGALVAAVLLLPIVVYLGLRRGSRLLAIGICVVLFFVVSAAAAYLTQNGTDVKRLLGSAEAYSVSNSSVYERQYLARDAWHEYLQHPILGSSIVERRSLAYPHNCVIEAFMATGTFGGAIFVLMLLMAIYRAIILTRIDVAMSWIPLCFFQQLIGAMFSGGLYGNAALWGMMAIVLGVDLPRMQPARLPAKQSWSSNKFLRTSGHSMTPGLLLAALLLAAPSVHGQAVSRKHPFRVFDATGFAQKPDLTQYGLARIMVIYPNFMWEGNKIPDATSLPDHSRITTFAQLANQTSDTVVIDIEHWPVVGDPAPVAESVKKYDMVLQWFKTSAPAVSVGLYGVLPVRDYWRAIQEKGLPGYAAWQKQDDSLASIAPFVDVLFPSVYTFYEDRDGWQKYAIAQIQEARRLSGGRPIYIFLWPQYHPSNKKLANTFLPGDYWRLELETARKYADGVVIWCCSNSQTWDDKAPWWLETRGFLKELDSGQR
jgi:O-antigen ligase